MNRHEYRPLLFWFAVATATTALLPIVVGALVTTLNAGMAFRDWPTSDGQGMFAYPWLHSAGDKFVEHGHRLAGIAIGCVSIAFASAVWLLEKRRWVRWCGVAVLLAVVFQGLLGGQRVLWDARMLAMVHGVVAAAVFVLMSATALFLSRGWQSPPSSSEIRTSQLKPLAIVTSAVIVMQYLVGGVVRHLVPHLGTMPFVHLGLAVVVLICVAATATAAQLSGSGWLSRIGWLLAAGVVCQFGLGAGSWITKYGLPSFGILSVPDSTSQVVFRTGHTVAGMALLMTSVLLVLRTLRVDSLRRERFAGLDRPASVPAVGQLEASLR